MSVQELIDSIESSSRFMTSLAAGQSTDEQLASTASSFTSAITLMINRTNVNTDTATLIVQAIDASAFSDNVKGELRGSVAGRVVGGTLMGRDDGHPKIQSLLHLPKYPYRLCQYLALVGCCSSRNLGLWVCMFATSLVCACMLYRCCSMIAHVDCVHTYDCCGHGVMHYSNVTARPRLSYISLESSLLHQCSVSPGMGTTHTCTAHAHASCCAT